MGGKCSSFNFIDLLFFDKQTWLQLPLSAFKPFLFDLATLVVRNCTKSHESQSPS